jgi:hypothetical protein
MLALKLRYWAQAQPLPSSTASDRTAATTWMPRLAPARTSEPERFVARRADWLWRLPVDWSAPRAVAAGRRP